MDFIKCCLLLITIMTFQTSCKSFSLEEELTLTPNQKAALDELKKQVEGNLPHDYMKKEIYLVKFLRYNDFDIQRTKTHILNMVKWRKENRMDEVLKEDFNDFETKYPYWIDGRDNDGRPVGSWELSSWNPREAVLSGNGNRLIRYVLRIVEQLVTKVREDQNDGKNVTQIIIIADLNGFNLVQYACVQCIPVYLRLLIEFDQNFPGMFYKYFLLNTPSTFDVLIRIGKPFLNREYQEALSIHGSNKKKWREAILKEIPPDQIRPQFGGTKDTGLDDY